jgi:hydrogenase-4 component E
MLTVIVVLFCLGASRLLTIIYLIAFQGFLVSILPLFLNEEIFLNALFFATFTLLIKVFLIPALIYFAMKKVAIKRELEPIIGYNASIFSGLVIIIVSIFISKKFNLPINQNNIFLLPAGITAIASGIFLIIARKKAITQVIGYLMMENGIYIIGLILSNHNQYMVEFGVLLDVLVGVMLMGIVLHNINRAFDDIDTTLLKSLRDL